MKRLILTIAFGFTLLHAQSGDVPAPSETEKVGPLAHLSGPEDEIFDDSGFDDAGFEEEFTDDAKPAYDPFEGYNRWMTGFNNTLFDYILNPVFSAYDFILPEPIRVSINNIFNNLYYPVSLVNNLLQLKFDHALTETGRFIINSTFGFAGMFDTAMQIGVEPHVEDFGQTLGHYGVGNGFPIVLPFFGPSNLRDITGDLIDFYVNPIYYVDPRKYNIPRDTYEGWGLVGYKRFNKFSLYRKEYLQIREEALDFYPFMRDAYEQNRNKLISE
ncbi:VacJ family lipoprotein [Sulfurimonas sp. HSL-3221]|uniref:MlaA family lipoprotein n=1 Tax=Sulfurimonadaceae TaxID=2771471 RepID=UPI001E56E8C1|nr:VacJ family lipoprotein [Sulfurimonas sp. HSL-3221]UFS61366.1 VacJ family lipoprotein [Sulfurimonas sp. HSL-3221]